MKHWIYWSLGKCDTLSLYYNWAISRVASSTLAGSFSWCFSSFCTDLRERLFEKFASSFCIFTKALFILLTFSWFIMFIFLRLVVTGFALFLAFKGLWLAIWNTFLDFCPFSLFLAIVKLIMLQTRMTSDASKWKHRKVPENQQPNWSQVQGKQSATLKFWWRHTLPRGGRKVSGLGTQVVPSPTRSR